MKTNLRNKPRLIAAGSTRPGDCFKYWPCKDSSPETSWICMRTDGRFCLTDCKDAWPVRFVRLNSGEECGTDNESMVEPLDLTATDM